VRVNNFVQTVVQSGNDHVIIPNVDLLLHLINVIIAIIGLQVERICGNLGQF